MYKKNTNDKITGEESKIIIRLSDNACIPFNPDNTDYQTFKKEINEGKTELRDAEGNVMTAQEAKQFIATLP
jgi:hypothetical protein